MRFIPCVLLFAAVAAADPVTLKVKLAKGKSLKVEQSVALTSNAGAAQKLKSGAVVSTGTKTPFSLVEKWTDTCVEEADGVPTELRRTIQMSRISTAKAAALATSQEGGVFLLSKGEKGASVKTEKGKPEELSVRLLQKGPVEVLHLLLPAGEVSEGDSWDITASDNANLQFVVSAGVAGAQGNARNALRKDIDDMDEKKSPVGIGMASSAGCEAKGTLKSVKDGVATIEFTGEFSSDSIAGAAGAPDLPSFKTTITGSLTFKVAEGLPVKLTWRQAHVHDPQEVNGGKIPGFTEEWMLTRTYSK